MAVDYRPQDPDTNADPFPVFRRLRDEDPVHWNDNLHAWVLSRYDHVKWVTQADGMSPDRLRPYFERLPSPQQDRLADLIRYTTLWMIFRDPPEHTRLRGLLIKVFTPKALDDMRPVIRRVVDECLDAVAEAGEMDLIRDLAYPLPATVIMTMLGVPRSDIESIKEWSDELAVFLGNARATPNKSERAQEGARQLAAHFRAIIARRRREPADDMITALIHARDEDDKLSEDEIVATCILLLFAGHETTTNLIGNGTYHLMRNPDEWRRMGEGPAVVKTGVEELLRYDGPVGAVPRVVASELDIAGTVLKEGDRVYALANAANRDPRQFPDPDRLDVTRRPNRHLAFGHGIHFCLGAALARIEAQIAFGEMTRRFPDMELATESFEWHDSLILRGLKKLPVAFTPSARLEAAV